MKKINKKQKLIGIILIILLVVVLTIVITNNIRKNKNVSKGEYSATITNAGSNLIANYIKEGVKIGGITGKLKTLDTSDATATEMDIDYGLVAYARGERIVGMAVSRDDIQIGDYVSYTPSIANTYTLYSSYSGYTSNQYISQESFNWRVLSKESDGTINIVSDKATKKYINLNGATGYNNGVYILNDICKSLYSNSSLGLYARSMNSKDFEKGMNEEGINYKNSKGGYNGVAVGTTSTIYSNLYYPEILAQENGYGIDTTSIKNNGIDNSDSYYSSPTTNGYRLASYSLTATQTGFLTLNLNNKEYYKDENFYNLIWEYAESNTYFLATRQANINNNIISYELNYVGVVLEPRTS